MQPRCKKCGRPLRDPSSVARGMGPECAGLSVKRSRFFRVRRLNGSGITYSATDTNKKNEPMFVWMDNENRQKRIPDQLAPFPPELLGLVLSAPAAGAIATHLKRHRRKKLTQGDQSPKITLKEIRRRCINLRMLFWPGFSLKGEPLACIPCGDDHWRIGKDGREINVSDLVSYLSRYGAI